MSENKSLVLPIFNGKDEAFQLWWTKFRAFATAKGFINGLLKADPDMPQKEDEELDPSNDAEEKETVLLWHIW